MSIRANKQSNIFKILLIAATAVICMFICCVLFMLNITHSVALEQKLRCNISEHIHTDDCYSDEFLICEKPAHSHDGNCYIVLLNENDINDILSLIGNNKKHSLEYVINDVVYSALNFNENLNNIETQQNTLDFSENTVAQLNTTISDEEELPDIVLNENINTLNALALENDAQSGGASTYSVGDDPVTSNYYANFYVYIDNEWTCIGNLQYNYRSNAYSSRRYDSYIATDKILELVNGALGTDYTYNSFDIAVASSLSGTYSTSNIGVGSVETIISYYQNSSNTQKTKYVRIIPVGEDGNDTKFNFYSVKTIYPEGYTKTQYVRAGATITLPQGNYMWESNGVEYEAGQTVTINKATTFTGERLGPITYVKVNYDVNFPTVSNVTFSTKPTLAGLSSTTVVDGYTEGSSMTIRNVSSQSVKGGINNNSTGLSRIVQFKGWQINDTDTIIQPNTTLVWEEILSYADKDELTLTAVWETDPLVTATFFVRYDSVAVDTEGNIGGQDQTKYTNELFATYVGGVDVNASLSVLDDNNIADTTSDNSFGADQKIRALYGEKTSGVWLYAFPQDEFIFEELKQYAESGRLSVEGERVLPEDLNHKKYAIRWYVFKVQDDAWHIDGKLVKKEGLIHVYKTFAGNKELVEEAKSDFYIDATDVTAGTNTILNLSNRTKYNADTDTYMWEITNVDYGEEWIITEHPHKFSDSNIEFSVYSEYNVMDAHGDQSITGAGTSLSVKGATYALDDASNEVLRAEFTNIYNRSDSIVIKKQDGRTGVSIGGATFKLMQNGKPLKFNYDSQKDKYIYDPANGTETVLSGNANGYFEIAIEHFSYDLGPITICEVTAPTGYTPIGNIEIGYVDDSSTIGILSGNSDLIKFVNGVLIVGNSTESCSVTAKKNWDCPQSEWQDVTLQLYANDKLVTTVIAGVAPEVVLNNANNWQHTWENLPVYVNGEEIKWSIKEIKIGSEQHKADGTFVNWLVSYDIPVITTDSEGNKNTLLAVTNTTKRVMLRLTKTNLDNTLQLSGAQFILEAVDAEGNILQNEISKTASTGENGTLIFDNLKCGIRYRLTETASPIGYHKINEYIYFVINEDGSVSVEESYYANAGNTAYNITVRNAQDIPLPESGSVGTDMFYAIGLLMMLAAGIYIYTFLNKRRCQN